MKQSITLWFLFLSILLNACREDIDDFKNPERLEGIFILNEGNYGSGNGDVSLYDPDTGTMFNNLFYTANQSSAGDVVQDMLIDDTLGILVVNNSNIIRIVSNRTFKLIKDIPMSQPRYLTQVDSHRVFISCYGGFVKVLSLATLTVTDSFNIGDGYPEELVQYGSKTYVAKSGWGYNNQIGVINNSTLAVMKNITVGYCPLALSVDYDRGRLYVACSGRSWDQPKVPGGIYVIDLITDSVVHSFTAIYDGGTPDTLYPTRIRIAGNYGYFINGYAGNVCIFHKTYGIMTGKINGNFYYVAVDANRGRIYATTCETVGHFKIYNSSLTELESHEVGAFPGRIVFYYK